MVFFKNKYYREISQDALTLTDALMTHQRCQLTLVFNIEIVIKELRQLRMSADFFANTSHDISRYPGV